MFSCTGPKPHPKKYIATLKYIPIGLAKRVSVYLRTTYPVFYWKLFVENLLKSRIEKLKVKS